MVTTIKIGNRSIGAGAPCFIIAEAGVNHNGDLEQAFRLVDAAVAAEADAVKFQTFRAESLVVPTAPKAAYQAAATGNTESQYAMLARLELSPVAHQELATYCQHRGILFLSTPFDEASVDLLDALGVPLFKVPSGELTNPFLLTYVAKKGRPLIISTGMADLDEVRAGLQTCHAADNQRIILLHCVSNYPADPADANLRAMVTMRETLRVPVGYSDHTPGIEVAIAAVSLGACVIEKHLTLDRGLPGPDHQASLDPAGFTALVRAIRTVEVALGHGRKEPAASEVAMQRVARRSLVAGRDIHAGSQLLREWIVVRRPGTGLPPAALERIIGRRVTRDIRGGDLLTDDMFE